MAKTTMGEFLAILRKSKGMTQQDAADRLGVSNKTVSGWETGAACPDISMLPAIAELFGVTAGAWLLVVAVYTATYIPRRKKFLCNLEKKGGR